MGWLRCPRNTKGELRNETIKEGLPRFVRNDKKEAQCQMHAVILSETKDLLLSFEIRHYVPNDCANVNQNLTGGTFSITINLLYLDKRLM